MIHRDGTATTHPGKYVFFLCLLLWSGPSFGDSLVLRTHSSKMEIRLAGGFSQFSGGMWLSKHWGVSVDVHVSIGPQLSVVSALSAEAGYFRRFAGKELGWQLNGILTAGLLAPTIEPGLALLLTPVLQGGYHGTTDRWFLMLNVFSPIAFQFVGDLVLRIPAQIELWLAFRIGPCWIGLQGAAGANFAIQQAPAVVLTASLFLSVVLGKRVSPPKKQPKQSI